MKTKDDDSAKVWVDLKARTIYIAGDIDPKMASKFRRMFHQIERDADRASEDITVEINSFGGDESAGMLIMDTIMNSQAEVITRATGVAMSMGACILSSGDIREMLPLSAVMIHQGSFRLSGRVEEAKNELREILRWEERLWDILDDRTKKARGFWKTKCAGRNLYLTAEKALKLGLIHRIARR